MKTKAGCVSDSHIISTIFISVWCFLCVLLKASTKKMSILQKRCRSSAGGSREGQRKDDFYLNFVFFLEFALFLRRRRVCVSNSVRIVPAAAFIPPRSLFFLIHRGNVCASPQPCVRCHSSPPPISIGDEMLIRGGFYCWATTNNTGGAEGRRRGGGEEMVHCVRDVHSLFIRSLSLTQSWQNKRGLMR